MKTLVEREAELIAKYPQIVKGSMRDIDPDETSEYYNKRTVQIICKTDGCSNKRRIATSDLHQVENCDHCVRTARLSRRRQARADRKAALKALEAAKPQEKPTEALPVTTDVKPDSVDSITPPEAVAEAAPKPTKAKKPAKK